MLSNLSSGDKILYGVLSFVFVLLTPIIGHTADKIYLNSGQSYDCKVLAIDTTTVTVDILGNEIKRTFYKHEVKVIIYDDGTAETFQTQTQTKPNTPPKVVEQDKELEKRIAEQEIKSAKSSGVATGVGFCLIILFVFLVV